MLKNKLLKKTIGKFIVIVQRCLTFLFSSELGRTVTWQQVVSVWSEWLHLIPALLYSFPNSPELSCPPWPSPASEPHLSAYATKPVDDRYNSLS